MRIVIFILVIFCAMVVPLRASIDAYQFSSPEYEQRFRGLVQELRCPKCQNQNIADSDAPLSQDLKNIIYEKIEAGESDEEIKGYLQVRYGDFILYKPPLKPSTYLLWYLPLGLVVIGFLSLYVMAQKRRRANEMTDRDKDRLAKILKDIEGE